MNSIESILGQIATEACEAQATDTPPPVPSQEDLDEVIAVAIAVIGVAEPDAARFQRRHHALTWLGDNIADLLTDRPAALAVSWRCWNCDEVFTREVDAAEHFGEIRGALTGCQIKGHENNLLAEIRKQEAQLASYRNDDSQIMRAMAILQSEVATLVRRAEDDGYGKGVRDMKAESETNAARYLALAAFCETGVLIITDGSEQLATVADGLRAPPTEVKP